MTAEDWWEQFHANACCPSASVARATLCGCGGSGELPSGVSRLLLADPEED